MSAAESRMGGKTRLVALSALMLFVELALIRWTGSNVLYLSYFSNFVLLGSFLGIGLGFLRAGRSKSLFPLAPALLALLVGFVRLFPVEINRSGGDLIFFGGSPTGLPRWLTLTIIFVVVAAVMAAIADGVARAFARFEALEAYRLDIFGSVLGIAAFSALSFLRAPPVVWGAVASALLLALVVRRGDRRVATAVQAMALLAMVVVLGFESSTPGLSWSPYYKVRVSDGPPARVIDVNGIGHQTMTRVADARTQAPVYFTPYERTRVAPADVLVIGAGSGTDVAIALAEGAEHVDAVEIDPRLYEIGKEQHPDRPYDDPRVDVHIDDGRAFLEGSNRTWDLILFALPDSLTLVSGQSSLRLESYLFTSEAMEEASEHLRPGGAFAMYNYYREEWLADRLAGTLAATYGQPPCIDRSAFVLRMMVASADPGALRCETTWEAAGDVPAPATDDRPFVYLREPGIPSFYVATIASILLASLVLIRTASGPFRRMGGYVDLFFMGVAFLLLETKNVVQFALLFGTTWFVNALVFGGILVTVLAAVEIARRVRLPRAGVLYAVLLAAVAVAWAVPPQRLLGLSPVPRFLLAVALAFGPVLVANLIFAQRFREVGSSTVAFGANLLGAMVGGLLEYASLVVGYRSLLMVVALLYGLAFVSGRAHLGRISTSDDTGRSSLRGRAPSPAR
ncbi:MAG: spermidine synthase [Acidimicrobiia bacterium]|nr:spermidine synthase [Acidimicrobiia bacterium]